VIRLDAATVLLQWATGGLLFLWVTTRRREVGLGYGWLLRGVYGAMAAGALAAGRWLEPVAVRDAAAAGVVVAAMVALVVSVVRRRATPGAAAAERERRAARVAAMTGAPRPVAITDRPAGPEYPPNLDLVAPAIGVIGLVAAGLDAGGSPALAVARTLVGAAFLGSVSDAMLLGHWYLTQPGLPRAPLMQLVRWTTGIWPVQVALLLVPTGMAQVLTGTVDDGWDGVLGWFWVACAVATIVLLVVTRAALRERYYSAVMAATGLLYLAILTSFGTDLVARAVLAG
jgi:hypothetical protein